jgi:hypothetical protein
VNKVSQTWLSISVKSKQVSLSLDLLLALD